MIRAQRFHDDDYTAMITDFLIDVFDFDERLGLCFIREIISVSRKQLNDEQITELQNLTKFLGKGDFDLLDIISSTLQVNEADKLIDVLNCPDDFYKKLIEEINIQYIYKRPMPLSILIRKLFENFIIDIFRKKYGTKDLSLYYDTSKRRFHDFSVLLKYFESKKADFHHISPNIDTKFIQELNEYREYGNSGAHSIDVNMKLEYYTKQKDDINHKVQLLIRVFNLV